MLSPSPALSEAGFWLGLVALAVWLTSIAWAISPHPWRKS